MMLIVVLGLVIMVLSLGGALWMTALSYWRPQRPWVADIVIGLCMFMLGIGIVVSLVGLSV